MTDYTAESIEVLSGLEPVRARPGMYTNTENPNHLAQEVIDNSVDEVLAGYATTIEVHLHADNSLSVADNGRGMPVDKHPEYGISGVELIMTRLHAGGKFHNNTYRYSGGLHGVGVSVVNALSSAVNVEIKRDGIVYTISFADGQVSAPLTIASSVGKRNTGSCIQFWANKAYFDSTKFDIAQLRRLLRAKAVLCANLTIRLKIEASGEQETWKYQDGLVDYLNELTPAEKLLKEPVRNTYSNAEQQVDWALQWQAEGNNQIAESYVNLIPTTRGGTHVNGLRNGLLEALREYCSFRNLLTKNLRLSADDVMYGCCYVLSVRIPDPQFSGQTKELLSSRETSALVFAAVRDSFSIWLNSHPADAEKIAQHVIERALQRSRAGKQVQRKKIASGPTLPAKLADCIVKDPSQCELFLVEGDSAGGSAKQARDKEFQAVMPLRGKIINSWELNHSQALLSREVQDIATALGITPGSDNLETLRYHKICFLADADSDGQHIATLLCALFTRHFRALVAGGFVYVAMPPLYRIDVGKANYYAINDEEKDRIIASHKGTKNIQVTRFKGLGEMNPEQLRETTIAPASRKLICLHLADETETYATLDMLLAKKRSQERKNWLENYGNLAEVV